MSQQRIFDIWKEAHSSRSLVRGAFQRMHLSVLHGVVRQQATDQLFVLRYEDQSIMLCEWKGNLKDSLLFEFSRAASRPLWLCLHFQGKFTLPGGKVNLPDTVFAYIAPSEDQWITLASGNQWGLLLGLDGAGKEQLLAELSTLRKYVAAYAKQGALPAVPLSYIDRRALGTLAGTAFGPFSTRHHIGGLILKLYTNYVRQLEKVALQPKDISNIQLYYRAVAYIRDNYLDKTLNRDAIADALCCSIRSLSRAFAGTDLSLNATILAMRLYKAREMLVQQPELSVEQIAFSLNFPDAKYFAVQYKKQFHRTPREERKAIKSTVKNKE